MANASPEPENTPSTSEIVQAVDREHYTPRPFREIPLLWLKIFKMDAAFFENEIQHTSVKNTFLSVFDVIKFAKMLQKTQKSIKSIKS